MTDLTIDIETVPTEDPEVIATIREGIKPPGNMKKQETIDAWWTENGEKAAEEAILKTSFDGTHGQVLQIAYAIGDEAPVALCRRLEDPEGDLLATFYHQIEKCLGHDKFIPRLIGHNYLRFDSRFLFQRSVIRGTRPTFNLQQDARGNSQYLLDTMIAWAGWGNFCNLPTICRALGIQVKTNGLTGADIYQAAKDGRYDEIREYGLEDVDAARAVARRLTFAGLGTEEQAPQAEARQTDAADHWLD